MIQEAKRRLDEAGWDKSLIVKSLGLALILHLVSRFTLGKNNILLYAGMGCVGVYLYRERNNEIATTIKSAEKAADKLKNALRGQALAKTEAVEKTAQAMAKAQLGSLNQNSINSRKKSCIANHQKEEEESYEEDGLRLRGEGKGRNRNNNNTEIEEKEFWYEHTDEKKSRFRTRGKRYERRVRKKKREDVSGSGSGSDDVGGGDNGSGNGSSSRNTWRTNEGESSR
jgi:hypothetical protein